MSILSRPYLNTIFIGMSIMGLTAAAQAVAIPGQGSWETTLQGRDLDGDISNGFEAYYDTVQNMTWLADANYIKTAGINQTGSVDQTNITITAYDIADWGLPATSIKYNLPCQWYSNGAGYQPSYICTGEPATIQLENSTTAYDILFGTILGNKSSSGSNYAVVNTGPFSNVQQGEYLTNAPAQYWDLDGVAAKVVTFSTITGQLERRSEAYYYTPAYNYSSYAMWTKAGDVGAVPEASTWALMVLGLAGIGLMSTRSPQRK